MNKNLYFLLYFFIFNFFQLQAQKALAPEKGDGTISNPYQIKSLENLLWIQQDEKNWNKHYIQMKDIDASAIDSFNSNTGWIPIGNNKTNFSGSYNGNKFTLKKLKLVRTEGEPNRGFFGWTSSSSIIVYLTLDSITINTSHKDSSQYSGALVGYNWGRIEYCKVNNSQIIGKNTDKNNVLVGGIAGYNNTGTIKNCTVKNCNLSATGLKPYCYIRVGGITGRNTGGIIENCSSNVQINAEGGGIYSGGIAGINISNASIINSYSQNVTTIKGNIVDSSCYIGGLAGYSSGSMISYCTANSIIDVTALGYSYAGGLIGYQTLNSFTTKCSSTGRILNTGSNGNCYGGGLIGYVFSGEVSFCRSNVLSKVINKTTTFYSISGGLVGYNKGTIYNSYASGIDSSISGYAYAGGLVGSNVSRVKNSSASGNSYAFSDSATMSGGLIAYMGDTALVEACFATGNNESRSIGSYAYSGGLISRNAGGLVQFSYATGNNLSFTLSLRNTYSGGLIGYGMGKVNNSYATGSSTSNGGRYTVSGGLIGHFQDADINYCYALGTCSNSNGTTSYLGGLIGSLTNGGMVYNSFYDAGVGTNGLGNGSSAGVIKRTKLQLQSRDSFLPYYWDFMCETKNGLNNYWDIVSTKNNGYPFLTFQALSNYSGTPPSVTSPIYVCLNSTPKPLIATGKSLKWYKSANSNFDTIAPTPTTSIADTIEYWVSQTDNNTGCESPKINLKAIVLDSKGIHSYSSDKPYTWNGITYYNSNFSSKDTLKSFLGCDSIVTLNYTNTAGISASVSKNHSHDIQLFPNPSMGRFFIQGDELETYNKIAVYNLSGKLVYFSDSVIGSMKEIDLSNLETGSYILKLESKDNSSIFKRIMIGK